MFAFFDQALIELTHKGVVLNSRHHGHEQHGAHAVPTTPNATFTAHRSAIAIEGCAPGQGSDLFIGQLTQLGKIAEQGIDDPGTYARHAEQDGTFVLPGGFGFDQGIEQQIDFLDLLLEMQDMPPDIGTLAFGHNEQPVFLHGRHFDQLPTAHEHILDFARVPINWPHLGLHQGGIPGDDGGIDAIGLGDLPDGTGKTAHL